MTELQKEYGEALYLLCGEEDIDAAVLDELEALKNAFAESPDYLRLLDNRALPIESRLQILDEGFSGRVHPYVLNFMKLLTERGAIAEFSGCATQFRQMYLSAHGIVEAKVTTAVALTDAQAKELKAKLEAMSGRQVLMQAGVNPELLGGVLVEMDGQRYDNTVRHRLEDIRHTLTEA
ncbi:MAG: ATP synthase F1 subunit delta [Clostridia bacterium]|nr:ATP synthase F1 subunit delta [Clostridia bacterium]MDO4356228.1 ATP synthase F1 subunit delta [Clostridia bacterium]